MTLTELRYVLALAKTQHFGRAATFCNVSQPTLSVAIGKLEDELGVALFERDRNTVKITAIGQAIVAQAQVVLEDADKLKSIAAGGKSQIVTPLRIGAIFTVGPYLFPNLIPQLKKIAPQMPLIIEENYTSILKQKLMLGEIDVIFVALPFNEPGIVTQPLYDEPFVVVMRKDHPLANKAAISPKDLEPETVLLLGEGNCFRQQVIEACPSCYDGETKNHAALDGTSIETLRHMVASGLGITILPSAATMINYYKSILCVKPFQGKVPQRRIALAWRVSFTRPRAVTALSEALHASHMHGVCMI